MQEQKSKQLLKARLLRERQPILKSPPKAPTLFVVTTDKQLQALADRFQKPRGIDLWTEKDGPESLAFDGKLSVQSTTPYRRLTTSMPMMQGRPAHSRRGKGLLVIPDIFEIFEVVSVNGNEWLYFLLEEVNGLAEYLLQRLKEATRLTLEGSSKGTTNP